MRSRPWQGLSVPLSSPGRTSEMGPIAMIVDEVRRHNRDGILEIKEAHERGTPIIGTYCGYMPWEIIDAAGAIAVSLCAKSEEAIPAAEEHLPRNLCPLVKSSYGHALRGTCPYFHFCDLIVAETTCDGKKKMYELMDRIKPVHLVQIPQRPDRPEDFTLMKSEFNRVRQRLEDLTDRAITDEALDTSIALRNRERSSLRTLWELSRRKNPPLTGCEIQEITDYIQFRFDKEKAIAWLEATTEALSQATPERDLSARPRILVTGCPIGGVMKTLEVLEETGALVVCFENCSGQKESLRPVEEGVDVMDALAEKYLAIGCSVMSPNPHRMEGLKRLIGEYDVDGVVEIVLTACHTYAVEGYSVRELVHSLGKSYLSIETDYSSGDREQLATRMGAFVEMF